MEDEDVCVSLRSVFDLHFISLSHLTPFLSSSPSPGREVIHN